MYANFWEKFLLVAGMASFVSNKNLVSLMELTLVIANGQRSSSFKRNQNQYCQAKNTGFELCHFFLNVKNYKFKTYKIRYNFCGKNITCSHKREKILTFM